MDIESIEKPGPQVFDYLGPVFEPHFGRMMLDGSNPRTKGALNKWRFSIVIGVPNSWMVYFMENPIEMDDLRVPPFMETPK